MATIQTTLPVITVKRVSNKWKAEHKCYDETFKRSTASSGGALEPLEEALNAANNLIKEWRLGAAEIVHAGHDKDHYFFLCKFY